MGFRWERMVAAGDGPGSSSELCVWSGDARCVPHIAADLFSRMLQSGRPGCADTSRLTDEFATSRSARYRSSTDCPRMFSPPRALNASMERRIRDIRCVSLLLASPGADGCPITRYRSSTDHLPTGAPDAHRVHSPAPERHRQHRASNAPETGSCGHLVRTPVLAELPVDIRWDRASEALAAPPVVCSLASVAVRRRSFADSLPARHGADLARHPTRPDAPNEPGRPTPWP